jgi:hypothetical protein
MRIIIALACLMAADPAGADALNGGQVAQIYGQCLAAADAKCNRATIYCNAYRRSYVKICLTKSGVSPDYIFMLLN